MSGLAVTTVTFLLIALSAFFVIIEFALLGARRHRLEQDAVHSRSARAALRGMNELTLMLAGAQLGITVCTFALGAVTKPAIDSWLGPQFETLGLPSGVAGSASFGLSLLLVTFLHLVIGEMAPKSWAITHPETAARAIGVPSRGFIWLFRPFLKRINALANRLVARAGVEPVDRAAVGGRNAATIRQLVEHSTQTGALAQGLQTQISEVIELQELTVRDITRPNPSPTSVRTGASVADVRAAAQRSGHLRILLGDQDGRLSQVVHVRDVLLEPDHEPAVAFARPVLLAAAALPVHELLRSMREKRVQLALVEGDGALVGVITLTDVVRRLLPHTPTAPAGQA